MVYVAALLFGASIGGLSAGLGSMIADLALGYAVYAPATLIIKGLEGTIVGFLASRNPYSKLNSKSGKILSIVAAISFACIMEPRGSPAPCGQSEATGDNRRTFRLPHNRTAGSTGGAFPGIPSRVACHRFPL